MGGIFPVKHSCLYNRVPKRAGGGGGGVGQSPGAVNFFPWSPEPHRFVSFHFTVEPGALKTFAAEPVAPHIKIRTFLHTDSVTTCFVCCLLGIGTKIVQKTVN